MIIDNILFEMRQEYFKKGIYRVISLVAGWCSSAVLVSREQLGLWMEKKQCWY